MKFFVILLFCLILGYRIHGYRVRPPVSRYTVEAKRLESFEKTTSKEDVKSQNPNQNLSRKFRETLDQAYQDAITEGDGHIDWYSRGIAESDYTTVLSGIRISSKFVQKYCGRLAAIKFPQARGILFEPSTPLPVPIANFTFQLPRVWFNDSTRASPVVSICYEGPAYLRNIELETRRSDWRTSDPDFRQFEVKNHYNGGQCGIRGILVILDGLWNNVTVKPKNFMASTVIHSHGYTARKTWDAGCDEAKGMDQPCCLWTFHITDHDGSSRHFRRCLGTVPRESTKNTLIPDQELATLLMRGGLTRRFLNAPERVCRGIEFQPFYVRTPRGGLMKLNKLDTTKCAAFY